MKKFAFLTLCLAAALAAGSGSFFDRAQTMQRAAAGLASRHGLAEAGLSDKLVARAFEFGGWEVADALRALGIAVPVFLLLLLVGILVSRLSWSWGRWGRRLLPLVPLAVFALGIWNGFSSWRYGIRDPRLLAPSELLGKAAKIPGRVFFSPNALFLAPLFAPEKIEPSSSLAKSSRLSVSPVDWRAEDRNSPFAAAVLCGQSTQFAPLLEMLQAIPGWRLAAVDNQGLLFIRGGSGIEEASLNSAEVLFSNSSDRAVYLAQSALVQKMLQRSENASKLMKAALENQADNPNVFLCAAGLAAQEGRWSAAREAAKKVLRTTPSSAQASYLLALATFESGSVSKAAAQIQSLARRYPEDIQILRLQARIARADNDPSTEVAALEKLLAVSKKRNLPLGSIHLLMGQAWAKLGFPTQALESYQAALKENPPAEVKAQVEEAMAVIRQRSR